MTSIFDELDVLQLECSGGNQIRGLDLMRCGGRLLASLGTFPENWNFGKVQGRIGYFHPGRKPTPLPL
jgi:hypothetical protein